LTELSVVIPVYRCRDCLPELHRRLGESAKSIRGDVEFVFVEDAGGDGSWEALAELAARDPRVKAYRLSRNFGQHAAITAGLSKATGRWVVVMDCDLQDPPEEIGRLYAKAAEGYDIVLARRLTKRQSFARRLVGKLYFALLNVFTGSSIDASYGSFSIISRKVVDAFLRLRDRDRHYLFILRWLGFETATIDYRPAERPAGRSSYGFVRLLKHALDGMFFQTTVLLRWIVYLGFAISLIGALAAVYVVGLRLTGTAYPGWASVFVLLLVLGGFIIVSTGVTGLYIGRIFDEVRQRPLFVVDREVDGSVEQLRKPPQEERIAGSSGSNPAA
jgi:glycosyltransferase involved in cell wall biosynthesis